MFDCTSYQYCIAVKVMLHLQLIYCSCKFIYLVQMMMQYHVNPLTSTWPHLRCDVGLEEREYRENCLCLAVLCTIIMVHKGTRGSYRSVDCIGL